ncbi:hypothetical protein Q5762_26875 [Streptomyces sp. P9(2023)]|uniref:hypothetical protein n=1 Tax=Streptomyces sp. P9(2023) TaxID=3064394 RepID=UPI0028F42C63|nr:hypothetical protein [Streptomyces sp. P9(2023)]MDT9691891.1 hypothetical protein [Streptomyces sp. P9(2023)]
MKKSPLVVLGGIAGTVALLIAGASPASADNSWGGYHWATTNGTAQLNVINSSTSDWTPRIQKAVAALHQPG